MLLLLLLSIYVFLCQYIPARYERLFYTGLIIISIIGALFIIIDSTWWPLSISLVTIIFSVFYRQKIPLIWHQFDPNRIQHMMALVFILLSVGLFVFSRQASLESTTVSVPLLIGQNIAFLLLALFGVGFPSRRSSYQELSQRLNIKQPNWRWVVGGTLTVLMLSLLWPPVYEEFKWIYLLTPFIVGLSEEVLFRGAVQPIFGKITTSLVFTTLHTQYSWNQLIFIFLGSMILGVVAEKKGISTGILIHSFYNLSVVLLWTL